jgi:ketosteroid isomerase-like protein
MSRENLDRTRAGWEFFNRTGRIDLDALHEDVAWHTREDLPNPRSYRGRDGVAALAADWAATFEDFGVNVEELIDGGEHVVAVLQVHGRIRGSSQELDMSEAHVGRWVDGKLAEVREYATREQALKAAGLAH